jgi:hypothetical protein
MNETIIPIKAMISSVEVNDNPIDGPNHTSDGNCLKAWFIARSIPRLSTWAKARTGSIPSSP